MLVVVVAMPGMPVLVVDVVHVVAMLDGRVTTVRAMLVAVNARYDMRLSLALVVVIVVLCMRVTVVEVIRVVSVGDRCVSAAVSVCVGVLRV